MGKSARARLLISLIVAIGVITGCGDDHGSTAVSEGSDTTQTDSETTATTEPDIPPEPGAPMVVAVSLSDGEAPATVFGPSDRVWLRIDLTQLTDEIVLNVRAEAIAGFGVREGFSVKGLTSNKRLERGSDFEGAEHIYLDWVSAPSDGWDAGPYRLTVMIEIVDETGAHATSTWSDEFPFTVEAP